MDLPKLSAGKRFTLPQPAGSADALLLAQLALREKAAGRPTAIITADAVRELDLKPGMQSAKPRRDPFRLPTRELTSACSNTNRFRRI